MDPDANLREQIRIARAILKAGECDSDMGVRLAELAESLDNWIRTGGSLPGEWRKGQEKYRV